MAFILENREWFLTEGGRRWPLLQFAKDQSRPFYLYDLGDARERARAFSKSRAHVHFAMKANSHPRLLKMFASEGLGVDVVSLGEMQKALKSGFSPEKIIFSGVGKGYEELAAATSAGVFQINVESFEELQLLQAVARDLKKKPRFALRINIHVAAPTHKNIQTATEESKFGLDQRQLPEVLKWVQKASELQFTGLAVHVGSQILDVGVFEQVSRKMSELAQVIQGHKLKLERLDLGGGLGLDYKSSGYSDLEILPSYFKALLDHHETGAQVLLEPGRFLVARMGILLAQVVHVKQGIERRFAILNAGMNALMRPALYQAFHRIERLSVRESGALQSYDIVGPLCESTDVFATGRESLELKAGDWVGVFDAGAYGAVMANTYNEMPRPLEISVLDGRVEVL